MSGEVPRLRMFAGPNGSGKSTLKTVLRSELLGVYLNPDEMEREMGTQGFLDLATYGVTITDSDAKAFFRGSTFLAASGLGDLSERVSVSDGRLHFARGAVNSYVASVTVDLFRQRLLDARATFTLETVMSHPSKVELLEQAQRLGYRTYLYFIATDDPEINISRVKTRVGRGGHAVPEDRIVKRYHASLGLLIDAIRHTNRAYIFDNSGEGQEKTWLAEVTEGRQLEMKTDQMPAWFRHAVWDRIVSSALAVDPRSRLGLTATLQLREEVGIGQSGEGIGARRGRAILAKLIEGDLVFRDALGVNLQFFLQRHPALFASVPFPQLFLEFRETFLIGGNARFKCLNDAILPRHGQKSARIATQRVAPLRTVKGMNTLPSS